MQAKKSLGQHFLRCRWVIETLIRVAQLTKKDTVLEIGPGTGILTRELARHASQVVAVEKDERLAAALSASLKSEGITNVHIVARDILNLFQTKLTKRSKLGLDSYQLPTTNYKLISNIPYYLTSRLLRILLESGPRPEQIALTIQKEVAQRIMAAAPDMNLLALSIQAYGAPRLIKTVPASCFSPRPKVDSAIISITNISNRFFINHRIQPEHFFRILHAGFNQKRKQLRNSLSSITPQIGLAFNKAKIAPTSRAQELSLNTWAILTKELSPKK